MAMTMQQRYREEQRQSAERKRKRVSDTLRWAAPAGLSLADVAKRLAWPGGTVDLLSILRALAEDDRAHEREGLWFHGPGATGVRAAPPATCPSDEQLLERVECGREWFRAELAATWTDVTHAQAMTAIGRLLDAGHLAKTRAGRVVRPRPSGQAGGAAAPCDTLTGPAPVEQAGAAPASSVGPERPVDGERASSVDPGTTAGRDQVVMTAPEGADDAARAGETGAVDPEPASSSAAEPPALDPSRPPRPTSRAVAGASLPPRLARIIEDLREHPWSRPVEVRKRLGMTGGTTSSAFHTLRGRGLVVSVGQGLGTRYAVTRPEDIDQDVVASVPRHRRPLAAPHNPYRTAMTELFDRLGVPPGSPIWRAAWLEGAISGLTGGRGLAGRAEAP